MIGSFWFNSFSAGGGGGGGTADAYELISTTVLSSNTASVTFSGLGTSAAAYKHLQIRAVHKQDGASNALYVRFNGDSGANYSSHYLDGNGSAVSSYGVGSQTSIYWYGVPGSSDAANTYGASVMDILDWSSTSKNKTLRSLSGWISTYKGIELASGAWLNTSALSSVSIFAGAGNWTIGSRFSLYGLKG